MQKAVLAQRNSCVFLVCNLKKVFCLLCALILAQFALTRVGYSQIISQYVETESGTSPKGMEIWNNSKDTLRFASYPLSVWKGTNGADPKLDFILEEGILAPTRVLIIGTSDMEASAANHGATFFEKNFTFNGDDALVIQYGDSITDVFGTPGLDPGAAWSGSGVSTNNVNLGLNFGIQQGDVNGWADPSIRFEELSTSPSEEVESRGLTHLGLAPATTKALESAGQWHLLSIPKGEATLAEIADDVLIQGVLGSPYSAHNPNIFKYDEQGKWSVPTSLDLPIGEGLGLALYHFGELGNTGDVPTVLDVTAPQLDVDVGVALNGSGLSAFTLVGNPFASYYNLSSIELNQGSLQQTVHIWDPTESTYESVMQSSDFVLSPWQAFWVETADTLADSLYFPKEGRSYLSGFNGQEKARKNGRELKFSLRSNLTLDKALTIYFHTSASYDWDIYDASKVIPITQWLGILGIEKESRLKSVESLPMDIGMPVLLPLRLITNIYDEEFTLEWKGVENLPMNLSCVLIDYETGERMDLFSNEYYQFTIKQNSSTQFSLGAPKDSVSHRFALLLQNNADVSTSMEDSSAPVAELRRVVSLEPNYPNPFNPSTTINYHVSKPTHVQLKVFDALGRLVTVLANGFHEIGEYHAQWNASSEASGVFYLQLISYEGVLTQKMLLLK